MRIVQVNECPEYVETVVRWIVEEWGAASGDEVKQMLFGDEACPPALLAVSNTRPMAVLGYKLHDLAQRELPELWVNALYVAADCRGRGIGSRLVHEGVNGAASFGRAKLYVYTDIPCFYERLGWQRFSHDNGMHVLEIRLQ